MISATKVETFFTETGYRNWKKALESGRGFSKHECSDSHKEATERLITAPDLMKIMRISQVSQVHQRTLVKSW